MFLLAVNDVNLEIALEQFGGGSPSQGDVAEGPGPLHTLAGEPWSVGTAHRIVGRNDLNGMAKGLKERCNPKNHRRDARRTLNRVRRGEDDSHGPPYPRRRLNDFRFGLSVEIHEARLK